jgi:hypothetical protein
MAQHHRHRLRPGPRVCPQSGQEGDVRAHSQRIATHAHAVNVGLGRIHGRRHRADRAQNCAAGRCRDVVGEGGRHVHHQAAIGQAAHDRKAGDQSAGFRTRERHVDRADLRVGGRRARHPGGPVRGHRRFARCGAGAPLLRRAQVAHVDDVADALESGQPTADLQTPAGGRAGRYTHHLGVPEQRLADGTWWQHHQRAGPLAVGGEAASADALSALQHGGRVGRLRGGGRGRLRCGGLTPGNSRREGRSHCCGNELSHARGHALCSM